jgi:hypothetical protein
MKDAFAEDLSDFIRNGKLDAYELTNAELAEFLEVWRWMVWRRRTLPSGPDADIVEVAQQLQALMRDEYGVEVDYNTLLLLREELEPLMHLRVLRDLRRAVAYFLQPRNLLSLLRVMSRARRYEQTAPLVDWRTYRRGYPRAAMRQLNEPAPDLVRRKYWRRVGPDTPVKRTWLP